MISRRNHSFSASFALAVGLLMGGASIADAGCGQLPRVMHVSRSSHAELLRSRLDSVWLMVDPHLSDTISNVDCPHCKGNPQPLRPDLPGTLNRLPSSDGALAIECDCHPLAGLNESAPGNASNFFPPCLEGVLRPPIL